MEAKNHDRHEFNFAKRLREKPVSLIEEKPKVSIADLRKRFPVQPIAVCDVGVEDLYGGKLSDWGYEREGILNIDHHSPAPEMARFISSANLAIDYVSQRGVLGPEWAVVINHTDCDSILSSGIMRGIIPPEARFGEAAISADHTGAKNDIADMLQGLEEKRDIEYSLRNLELLLGGLPLDKDAKMALEKSRRPEILSLAAGIIEAQTREISDMTAWYQSWFGTAVPVDSTGAMGGMGHGAGMQMMSMEGDLETLRAAKDFDTEFLQQMIPHHEMAIMMARMLAAASTRSEMQELADNIITSQSSEIELMRSWLSAW